MKGVFLRFYMHENHKHRHDLLYQWLLQEAKKLGIHGGTVFRAVAGFGHHGKLHFQHFYELAGDLTMQLDFVVSDAEADRLLSIVKNEGVRSSTCESRPSSMCSIRMRPMRLNFATALRAKETLIKCHCEERRDEAIPWHTKSPGIPEIATPSRARNDNVGLDQRFPKKDVS